MPQRLSTCALLTLAAVLGATDASALGFGRSQRSATLGHPLDFSVLLRFDSGEQLAPECVAAEVTVGETALPRLAVSVQLEAVAGAPAVRVRTSTIVDEPVVAVTVIAGCEAKVSRKFTLFADPPLLAIGPAPLADAQYLPSAAPAPAAAAAPASEPTPTAVPAPVAAPQVAPAARQATPPTARAARPARAAVRTARAKPIPPPTSRLRLEEPTAATTATAAAVAASAAQQEAALQAAEQAVNAASAVVAAASQRVTSLEQSVESLKRESVANRESISRLRQALAESEQRGRWSPALLAALLVALGGAAWLVIKLREARAQRNAAWWNAAQAVPDAAVEEPAAPVAAAAPTAPSVSIGEDSRHAAVRLAQPLASAPAVDAATFRTVPLPPAVVAPETQPREVTIEELLDLEQQAEFFIVLGQDDAAIDLLVGHLRSVGGTSPLPYLKLLEIYRRRGDEAAYERTRDRFNHRFNAVAPGWSTDLQAGRTLQDYPEVVARLERCWPRPMDAMAELETLLFRTDGGLLFDLPAYREVLFLCSLARDLHEDTGHHAPRIDVLLPLADAGGPATAAARPRSGDDEGSPVAVDLIVDDRPTSPVDLDLSEPAPRATSDFGFFESQLPKPG